MSFWN